MSRHVRLDLVHRAHRPFSEQADHTIAVGHERTWLECAWLEPLLRPALGRGRQHQRRRWNVAICNYPTTVVMRRRLNPGVGSTVCRYGGQNLHLAETQLFR